MAGLVLAKAKLQHQYGTHVVNKRMTVARSDVDLITTYKPLKTTETTELYLAD